MIRVLITDDHPGVRAGLAELLRATDDLQLVGVAGCGTEGVRMTRELCPDVVLMDMSMPEMSGRAAADQILADCPDTRVVILTAFADRDLATGCGASSWVLKDAPPAELLGAVRAAAARERAYPPDDHVVSPVWRQ